MRWFVLFLLVGCAHAPDLTQPCQSPDGWHQPAACVNHRGYICENGYWQPQTGACTWCKEKHGIIECGRNNTEY